MTTLPDPAELARRLATGDRTALARSITLVESRRSADQEAAYELLRLVMPAVGDAHRIGISGPPGVGKSTLMDSYGVTLVERGHRVAVLAVDPSSSRSGGSILGDKSRMHRLAQLDGAFIRPSPSDLELGGVTRRTREAMFLCEAAGFDRILIETVGVGQSEIDVAAIVDTFVVLLQPGSGDELQGIKKGILELADLIAVNKADGEQLAAAREAQAEFSSALRYLRPRDEGWQPEAIAISARTGDGLERLAGRIDDHYRFLGQDDRLAVSRRRDLERWLWSIAEAEMLARFRQNQRARRLLSGVADDVAAGRTSALAAAAEVERRS